MFSVPVLHISRELEIVCFKQEKYLCYRLVSFKQLLVRSIVVKFKPRMAIAISSESLYTL